MNEQLKAFKDTLEMVNKTINLISNSDVKLKDAVEVLNWLGTTAINLNANIKQLESEQVSKQESIKVIDNQDVIQPVKGDDKQEPVVLA